MFCIFLFLFNEITCNSPCVHFVPSHVGKDVNDDGSFGLNRFLDRLYRRSKGLRISVIPSRNHNISDSIVELARQYSFSMLFQFGYQLRKNPRIDGAIVTSPWLRLSFEPARSKVVLASLMKYILPGLVQPSGLNVEHLSSDTEVVRKYSSDPLVHDRVSVSLFHGAMNAAAYALNHSKELQRPLLLIHGDSDQITSPEGSRQFAENNSLVTLRIWENGRHELHNEPFRDDVFRYIAGWIKGGDAFRRKNA